MPLALDTESAPQVDASFLQEGDVVWHRSKPRVVTHLHGAPSNRVQLWHHGRTLDVSPGDTVGLLMRDNVKYTAPVGTPL